MLVLASGRSASSLELLEPEGERLVRQVGARPRHLDERELERQAGIAALAHVVDGDREQVAEPQHGRLADLVRLRAQPVACLVRHRHPVRHLAEVLDEQEVAQVLEQVGDEPTNVEPLSASSSTYVSAPAESWSTTRSQRRNSASSSVAPSSWSKAWTRDLAAGRRRELVERRHRVAKASLCGSRDERQSRVRHVEALAVRDPAQEDDEL